MENNHHNKFKKSQLSARTASAAILIPLVLFLVWYGSLLYSISIIILAAIMMKEWIGMINSRSLSSTAKIYWMGFAGLYTAIFCTLMIYIRLMPSGLDVTIWMLLCVWATDTGAYFTGITVGGPKIASKISPSKTWSGLAGAIICSASVGYIYAQTHSYAHYPYFIASLGLPIIAQAGDFLESAVKRYFNVKDSGNIIPGHGGILDRVDGLVTAVIFTWIIEMLL